MEDLQREHYVKKERMHDLFATEQEALVPLPRERFRVFALEKVKTDKYSFIQFAGDRYSTSPEYVECEMWLEIGTSELKVLNEKYEQVVSHQCKYAHQTQPEINFENYICYTFLLTNTINANNTLIEAISKAILSIDFETPSDEGENYKPLYYGIYNGISLILEHKKIYTYDQVIAALKHLQCLAEDAYIDMLDE